jgi:CRP-like cAMP-binding protein
MGDPTALAGVRLNAPQNTPHSAPQSPLQHTQYNALLANLSPAEFELLSPSLELVSLRLGDMLYEPSEQLRHAYFPCTAMVSLYYATLNGASAQSCSVGHEGMVGISLFMGGNTTASSAVVSTGGQAWRLDRHVLMQAFEQGGALRRSLLRYVQALMTQIVQTAACYRHHNIEQQLSAWLMSAFDRMPPGELVMTQELLGNLLGVRRESITLAAGNLQSMGLISYRRGHISVLDASGLRHCACECYDVVKREMYRLAQA